MAMSNLISLFVSLSANSLTCGGQIDKGNREKE